MNEAPWCLSKWFPSSGANVSEMKDRNNSYQNKLELNKSIKKRGASIYAGIIEVSH